MADETRNDNPDIAAGTAADIGEGTYHEEEKRSALDELVEVARDLRDDLGRLFGAGKHVAGEQIDRLRKGAGRMYGNGRERASAVASDAGDYVREQPMRSLLIAAGAGLLLGFLLRRTTSSGTAD